MIKDLKEEKNKAFDELDKVRTKVDNVYLIFKNGEKVGLITNRWTYTQWYVAHVTFIMYGLKSYEQTIGMTKVLGGCGYDKIAHGMEWILNDLREPLKEKE